MRITLVRHGETTGESSIRYYGATDVPLSALGEEQMRRAGAALAGERFDAVVSSRLQRARRGAVLVSRREPTQIAAFDEVNFGRWEGWTREEIETRDADHYRIWQRDLDSFVYPEGECRQAFRRRVSAGFAQLLAEPPGENLLLVVHRGVIAVILSDVLELTPADRRTLEIDLGSIHVVERGAAGWRSDVLNRIDHLNDVAPQPAEARA